MVYLVLSAQNPRAHIVCREEEAFQKLMRDRVHHAKSTLDTGRRKSKHGRRQQMPNEQSHAQQAAALPLVAQDIDEIEGELLLSVHSESLLALQACQEA